MVDQRTYKETDKHKTVLLQSLYDVLVLACIYSGIAPVLNTYACVLLSDSLSDTSYKRHIEISGRDFEVDNN